MTRSPQSAMRGRYDRKMERTPGHLRRVCCELDRWRLTKPTD